VEICSFCRKPFFRAHPTERGKVTLIELGFLILFIGLFEVCMAWAYHRYGWRGIAGVVGGFVAFYVVLPLVVGVGFVYLMALIYTGNPYYPACRTGKCQRFDYQRRRLFNGEYALFCQCGGRYRKRGRRFLEVQGDGFVNRYMIWKAFRGWFPDG
jgi:uncharacterized membrane protein